MSFPGLQAPLDLDTMFTDNWTAANTDSVTPIITDNLTQPWETLDVGANDFLYIKFEIDVPKTGLHADYFFHNISCSVEIITGKRETTADGRAHFKKVMDEAARILKANSRLSGYYLNVFADGRARYVKDKGMFLGTIFIDMKKVMTS